MFHDLVHIDLLQLEIGQAHLAVRKQVGDQELRAVSGRDDPGDEVASLMGEILVEKQVGEPCNRAKGRSEVVGNRVGEGLELVCRGLEPLTEPAAFGPDLRFALGDRHTKLEVADLHRLRDEVVRAR